MEVSGAVLGAISLGIIVLSAGLIFGTRFVLKKRGEEDLSAANVPVDGWSSAQHVGSFKPLDGNLKNPRW